MTRAFISYHHRNDQDYRNHISDLANTYNAFEDRSVELDEIDDGLPPQSIRTIIRDNYLRDTQVTILLCGTETRFRKHVDWELKSSMIDGAVNRRSGILVIDLPTTSSTSFQTSLPDEKATIYPNYTAGWSSVETKASFQERFREMPERIIDNLVNPNVAISVVPWFRIENRPENLRFLVDATARVARSNEYDLSRPMKMRDHNPQLGY